MARQQLSKQEIKKCELQAVQTHLTALHNLLNRCIIDCACPAMVDGVLTQIESMESWEQECLEIIQN